MTEWHQSENFLLSLLWRFCNYKIRNDDVWVEKPHGREVSGFGIASMSKQEQRELQVEQTYWYFYGTPRWQNKYDETMLEYAWNHEIAQSSSLEQPDNVSGGIFRNLPI